MIADQRPELLWVVVKVESGIPVGVEAYGDARSALAREREWRKGMNPDNDETGVFPAEVGQGPGACRAIRPSQY